MPSLTIPDSSLHTIDSIVLTNLQQTRMRAIFHAGVRFQVNQVSIRCRFTARIAGYWSSVATNL